MCTTIKLQNSENVILAQNYDFYYGHGLVIVNKKGVLKVALVDDLTKESMYSDKNSGAKWESKYGSVTFNQFGREIPTCGMNEAGLAVVSMWHNTEQKPVAEGKNQITELQWIQMQLDLYKTVDEVLNNLNLIFLSVRMYPMHYHLSDKSGKSIIVELKNGKLKAFSSSNISGCGNEGLEETIEYTKKYQDVLAVKIKINEPTFDRAAIAIKMAHDFNQKNEGDIYKKTFEILDKVRWQVGFGDLFRWLVKKIPPTQTFWQVVFDISKMKIYFKTKSGRKEKIIDFASFDFYSKTLVRIFDIENKASGNISKLFQNYSREENARIVKTSFAPVKKEFPESEQGKLIEYPELLKITKIKS